MRVPARVEEAERREQERASARARARAGRPDKPRATGAPSPEGPGHRSSGAAPGAGASLPTRPAPVQTPTPSAAVDGRLARRVDEVEGEEAVEDVEQEIGGFERHEETKHLSAADSGERLPHGASERRCSLAAARPGSGARQAREEATRRREPRSRRASRRRRRRRLRAARPADVAEGAGERPAGHVARPPRRVRRPSASPGRARRTRPRRVAEQERGEQRARSRRLAAVSAAEAAKASRRRRSGRRRREVSPGGAEQRIERAADEAGHGEDEPDLGVAQAEVVPDRRPRGRAGAADELVEQLDREQRRDEGRGATPGGSGSAANRHSRILAHPPPRVERQSAAYENVHWTVTVSVAPPALR